MISKSLLTMMIAQALKIPTEKMQERVIELRAMPFHDRSKGEGLRGKSYSKGNWYNQRKGPFNKEHEQTRRLKQLSTARQSPS
jgi:hypothetical protein